MTQTVPRNAYTSAPEQHPNLILGGFQLFFWLFFHPSAWRNHVARIEPKLHPNFCLIELRQSQWKNLALQRLVIQAYLVWLILGSLIMGVLPWGLGKSGEEIAFVAAFVMTGSAALILTGSIASGLAFILVGSMLGGVAGYVTGSLVVSVLVGVTSSVVNSVNSHKSSHSVARQIGGICTGIVIGAALVGIAVGVADSLLDGGAAVGVAGGIWVGIAFIVTGGLRTRRWARSLAVSLILGAIVSLASVLSDWTADGVVDGAGVGILLGAWFIALFVLPYSVAERIAGSWAGALAGVLGSSGVLNATLIANYSDISVLQVLLFSLGGILTGLSINWWRPLLFYPFQAAWNTLLYRADEQQFGSHLSFLRYHSAFWDEFQRLPLLGLDEHVVLVAERNTAEGQAVMDHLSASSQRWAAQAAQIELDALRLEHCTTAETIGQAHRSLAASELESPVSALLRSFRRISEDVNAGLNQESTYNQRLALSAITDRLDGLLREFTRSSDKYTVRFRPIVIHWRQIITNRVQELTQSAELRQELDSPYIIGVPLTEQQEIFVGRTDISTRIEQLLLDRRRPPLLLYGQRRMGKTSLLNNLGRLLPNTIIPMFVDLQGPASRASDHTGFLYNIARGMADSAQRQSSVTLPPLTRETLAVDPFTSFDEWLDQVEQTLGQNTALLALDEFEVLDKALTDGRFNETDVLGMLRNLIQHRPRFKVLVSGSHTLQEFQRWASYLINAQVVHLGYLQEAEVRQLVERPVKDFALRYQPDASQRVLDLTRGHPFLVQLLCAEIV
ncbi:MAG: hypothetical protein QNJ46_27380, partial [Leptolyngbyaceae cyanobacterium MO_188.B28]|nr:hypothetical protein [Leptolyngbyaceae cyanobacterium MO_188.B28]